LKNFFSKLKLHLLLQLCEGNNIKGLGKKPTIKKCVGELIDSAIKKGSNDFISALDKELLKETLQTLGHIVDHDSRTRLAKDFKTELDKYESLHEFFGKMDRKVLDKFGSHLGFEIGSNEPKSEVEDALSEEILINGCKLLFETMTRDFATDCAKELFLKYTLSKGDTINLVLGQSYPHLLSEKKEKKEKKEKTEKKEIVKVNIKSGVESQQLHDSYYREELSKWCKDNGLKSNGSKKDLIKIILKYLQDGKLPEDKKKKKRKKQRFNGFKEKKDKKIKR